MVNKLVIRFIKMEKALVAQQLEIKVSNKLANKYEDNHVLFKQTGIDFADDAVWLSKPNSPQVAVAMFDTNGKRDQYLKKVLSWISCELFRLSKNSGKLKIGQTCEVSNDQKEWVPRQLIAIYPEELEYRYYAKSLCENKWRVFLYARPLKQEADFSVDGDIYTWERRGEDE